MSRLNPSSRVMAARPSSVGTTTSKSVRKIDNGYVESSYTYNDKTGVSHNSETYCADDPSGGGDGSKSSVGNESLSDTKAYLGSDV